MSDTTSFRALMTDIFAKQLHTISARLESKANHFHNAAACRKELLVSMARCRDDTQRIVETAELHVHLMDTRKHTKQQEMRDKSRDPSECPHNPRIVAEFVRLTDETTDPLFIPLMDRMKLVESRIDDIGRLFVPMTNPVETEEQWRNIDLSRKIAAPARVAPPPPSVQAATAVVPSGIHSFVPVRTRQDVLDERAARLAEQTVRVKQEANQTMTTERPVADKETSDNDEDIPISRRFSVPLPIPTLAPMDVKREPTPTTQFRDDGDGDVDGHDITSATYQQQQQFATSSSIHAAAAAPAAALTAATDQSKDSAEMARRSEQVKRGIAKAKEKLETEAKVMFQEIVESIASASKLPPGSPELDQKISAHLDLAHAVAVRKRTEIEQRKKALAAAEKAVDKSTDTDEAKRQRTSAARLESTAFSTANAEVKKFVHMLGLFKDREHKMDTRGEEASGTDTEDEVDDDPSAAQANPAVAALVDTGRAIVTNPSVAALIASRGAADTPGVKKVRPHPAQDSKRESKKAKAADTPPPLVGYTPPLAAAAASNPPSASNTLVRPQPQPSMEQQRQQYQQRQQMFQRQQMMIDQVMLQQQQQEQQQRQMMMQQQQQPSALHRPPFPGSYPHPMGHSGMMPPVQQQHIPFGTFNPTFNGSALSMPPLRVAEPAAAAAVMYSTQPVVARQMSQYEMAFASATEVDRQYIEARDTNNLRPDTLRLFYNQLTHHYEKMFEATELSRTAEQEKTLSRFRLQILHMASMAQ